ncbi:hypothetical protein DFH28DRAFT_1146823 [Melampsora americana]|nr:hypothetical protein DFH28DRAFT_1146823 [Melampsora americana]
MLRKIYVQCLGDGKKDKRPNHIGVGLTFPNDSSPKSSCFGYSFTEPKLFFLIEGQPQRVQLDQQEFSDLQTFYDLLTRITNTSISSGPNTIRSFLIPLLENQSGIDWQRIRSGNLISYEENTGSLFWKVVTRLPTITMCILRFSPHHLSSPLDPNELIQSLLKINVKLRDIRVGLQKIGGSVLKMLSTVNLVTEYPEAEIGILDSMRRNGLRRKTLIKLAHLTRLRVQFPESDREGESPMDKVTVLYLALGAYFSRESLEGKQRFQESLKVTQKFRESSELEVTQTFARRIGLQCYLHCWDATLFNERYNINLTLNEIALQNRLNYRFQNPTLLRKALTPLHKQFRLIEWIGDSVLDVWAAYEIFTRQTDISFVGLTNNKFLHQRGLSKSLELHKIITKKPSGEKFHEYKWLSKVVEALIGAVFLDRNKVVDPQLFKVIEYLIKS